MYLSIDTKLYILFWFNLNIDCIISNFKTSFLCRWRKLKSSSQEIIDRIKICSSRSRNAKREYTSCMEGIINSTLFALFRRNLQQNKYPRVCSMTFIFKLWIIVRLMQTRYLKMLKNLTWLGKAMSGLSPNKHWRQEMFLLVLLVWSYNMRLMNANTYTILCKHFYIKM